MSLDRILSIIAALLGFSGSIVLAKGILKLTPSIIAKQSQTYWGYNKLQLGNIASQKADFVCGVFLIFIAFIAQIINFIFIYNSSKTFSLFWSGLLIVCSVFPILAIMLFINKFLVKQYTIDSQKSLAKQILLEDLGQNKISYNSWESLLNNAEHLCNLKKRDDESPLDFLKRYSNFLGVKIPDNIDLSELQKKNKTAINNE